MRAGGYASGVGPGEPTPLPLIHRPSPLATVPIPEPPPRGRPSRGRHSRSGSIRPRRTAATSLRGTRWVTPATVTAIRSGAFAFHRARRLRVFDRDIRRFGTAISVLLPARTGLSADLRLLAGHRPRASPAPARRAEWRRQVFTTLIIISVAASVQCSTVVVEHDSRQPREARGCPHARGAETIGRDGPPPREHGPLA